MADIYINDNALIDFERAGVEDAYPLWVDSVRLLSQTGESRMTISHVNALRELGDYDRDASSMAESLVSIGYWGAWGDIRYLVANGSWALNE